MNLAFLDVHRNEPGQRVVSLHGSKTLPLALSPYWTALATQGRDPFLHYWVLAVPGAARGSVVHGGSLKLPTYSTHIASWCQLLLTEALMRQGGEQH